MKLTQFLLCLLSGTLAAGCAEQVSERSAPAAATVASVESPANPASSKADAVDSAPSRDTYPEKAEVLRLMHQADAEFNAGRFVDALATVEQALHIDPASPLALRLKSRITQILLRS